MSHKISEREQKKSNLDDAYTTTTQQQQQQSRQNQRNGNIQRNSSQDNPYHRASSKKQLASKTASADQYSQENNQQRKLHSRASEERTSVVDQQYNHRKSEIGASNNFQAKRSSNEYGNSKNLDQVLSNYPYQRVSAEQIVQNTLSDRHSQGAMSQQTASFGYHKSKTSSIATQSRQQNLVDPQNQNNLQTYQEHSSKDQQRQYLRDKTNLMHLVYKHGGSDSQKVTIKSTNIDSERRPQKQYGTTEVSLDNNKKSFQANHYIDHNAEKQKLDWSKPLINGRVQKQCNESKDVQATHLENARIARQRIDLQTISEPSLCSGEDQITRGSSLRESRVKPYVLVVGKKNFADAKRYSVEEQPLLEYSSADYQARDERRAGTSQQRRDDSLDSETHENSRQFSHFQQSHKTQESGRENVRSSSSRQSQKANCENIQNQIFKSEQFQMNRNQTGHQNHQLASGGQSNSSQIYAKHFSGSGTSGSNNRGSKQRQPELSRTAVDHQAQIASYLTAQPTQSQTYGRRDDKGSSALNVQQYGAQVSSKVSSNQGEKYTQQHHSSNLLHKNSKEGYFNQLYQAGSSQNTKSATQHEPHHASITKQQMIQNLNQRYLAQNQSMTLQQQPGSVQLHGSKNFEHTNLSSDIIAAESHQQQKHSSTAGLSRSKARSSGKSQTQSSMSHTTGAQGGVNDPHSSMKHTKSSQAKTATQLQPRKSSTSYYPSQASSNQIGSSQKNGYSSSHHHAVMYNNTANVSSSNHHERPHTAMAGHSASNTNSHTVGNRSFTGTGHHSNVGLGSGQENNNVSKTVGGGKRSTKSGAVGTRSSTSTHMIKGRNLNSNTGASKKSVANDMDGTNASQILAVNMLPTSQPSQFGTATTVSSYQRSSVTTGGNNTSKNTNNHHQPQRPQTAQASRAKSSAQMKHSSNTAASISKSSLLTQTNNKQNQQNNGSSHIQTPALQSRISTQGGASTIKASHSKQANMSHMVMLDENDSILDLKQIEDMMRASQKSNIFNVVPPDANERNSVPRDRSSIIPNSTSDRNTFSMQQSAQNAKQSSNSIMNTSNLLHDISITSPQNNNGMYHQHHEQRSSDAVKKAQLRLETVCLLLAENGKKHQGEKEKQQTALTNVLEELVFNQPNKYDSQCLRLLMDYQWQSSNNAQTYKLQDELIEVKARFEIQSKMSQENKELKEQLAKQKLQLQDQDRSIRKLERELNQVKSQFEVDNRETRIRDFQESSNAQVQKKPDRAVSQQNRRSSNLVPPLDLTKVKAYEEHIREKQAAQQKLKEKTAQYTTKPLQKNLQSENKKATSIDKQGSAGQVPHKSQMQTLQHNTKVNNFIGNEVNLNNLNTIAVAKQQSKASQQDQQHSFDLASRSLSPSMKSKGRNQNYLNQMRHSQENRPTSKSNFYSNNNNTSFDKVRQQHNYSATIEGSRIDDSSNIDQQHDRLAQRKHSMPPASVHIPLLDFSKLNQPKPTQSRAAAKATQPKQSMSQQHSKYQTIDASGQNSTKFASGAQQHASQHQHNHYGVSQAQQSQTIQHNTGTGYSDLQYAKKRGSYEHVGMAQNIINPQLAQSIDGSRSGGIVKESIGASQSMKVMAQSVDNENSIQIQMYSNSNGNLGNKKLSQQLTSGVSQSVQQVPKQSSQQQTQNGKYYYSQMPKQSSSNHHSGTGLQQRQHEILKQQQQQQQVSSSFKADFNTCI